MRPAPKFAKREVRFIEFAGGWDVQTPPLLLAPGFVRSAQNYECGVLKGYDRISGYERFSGKASPSDAGYAVLTATITGGVSLNDTLTGSTSGATAKIAGTTSSYFVLTQIVDNFLSGENLQVGGITVAVATDTQVSDGAATPKLHAQYRNLAADVYRAQIEAVPGSGPVRGLWFFNDVLYAFRNDIGGSACVMYRSTAVGWVQVTISLLPGGTFEFENANFGGQLGTRKMYWVDGVNKGYEFDGTTAVAITTGMTIDRPSHVTIHRNHLFYAFGSSVQHSGVGTPHTWSLLSGAAELATGDTITGFQKQAGSTSGATLLITCRNRLSMLYGSGADDWVLVSYAEEQGAYPRSMQRVGVSLMLDDRGIATLQTSQNFGNFANATISQRIQSWIAVARTKLTSSCIVRDKNQYRLFFSDKYALYITFESNTSQSQSQDATVVSQANIRGIMPILFAHDVVCSCSNETVSGTEAMFFGSSDGFVYQMDKGTSFDGEEIEAFLDLAFDSQKRPRQLKRYKHVQFEVQGDGYAEFNVSYELGYGNTDIGQPGFENVVTDFSAVFWDEFTWDAFTWDGTTLMPSNLMLEGTAENISLKIRSVSDYFAPCSLSGALIDFSQRRSLR